MTDKIIREELYQLAVHVGRRFAAERDKNADQIAALVDKVEKLEAEVADLRRERSLRMVA